MTSELCQRELSELLEARSNDEICRKVQTLAHRLGFEYFIFGARRCTPQGKVEDTVLNGYPPNWRQVYESRQYIFVDPTVRHALSSHLPLLWSPAYFAQQQAHELYEHARQYGLRGGLTVPIHCPDHSVGMLSLAGESENAIGTSALQTVAQARLLGDYLHEALQRLSASRRTLTPDLFSNREAECLRWAAAGKTSWEIGRILGLSERTVNFHIGNAMRKLEATTRGQALAKAMALQLIQA